MNRITIIPPSEFRTSRWSGGSTTELFIWPEGASYAERRFRARISSAAVELEESVFTPLPGVKRFLTPLCRGFSLTVNGRAAELPHGSVLEFSGSDKVVCRGSGRDLNLMLKDCGGEMRIVAGGFIARAPISFVYSERGGSLRFAVEGGEAGFELPAGAFARLAPGEYRAQNPAVLFEVFPEAPVSE